MVHLLSPSRLRIFLCTKSCKSLWIVLEDTFWNISKKSLILAIFLSLRCSIIALWRSLGSSIDAGRDTDVSPILLLDLFIDLLFGLVDFGVLWFAGGNVLYSLSFGLDGFLAPVSCILFSRVSPINLYSLSKTRILTNLAIFLIRANF